MAGELNAGWNSAYTALQTERLTNLSIVDVITSIPPNIRTDAQTNALQLAQMKVIETENAIQNLPIVFSQQLNDQIIRNENVIAGLIQSGQTGSTQYQALVNDQTTLTLWQSDLLALKQTWNIPDPGSRSYVIGDYRWTNNNMPPVPVGVASIFSYEGPSLSEALGKLGQFLGFGQGPDSNPSNPPTTADATNFFSGLNPELQYQLCKSNYTGVSTAMNAMMMGGLSIHSIPGHVAGDVGLHVQLHESSGVCKVWLPKNDFNNFIMQLYDGQVPPDVQTALADLPPQIGFTMTSDIIARIAAETAASDAMTRAAIADPNVSVSTLVNVADQAYNSTSAAFTTNPEATWNGVQITNATTQADLLRVSGDGSASAPQVDLQAIRDTYASNSSTTAGPVDNSRLDVVNPVTPSGDPVQGGSVGQATGENNLVIAGSSGQQVFFTGASQDGFSNIAGSLTTDGLRPGAEDLYGVNFATTVAQGSSFLSDLGSSIGIAPVWAANIADFSLMSGLAQQFLNIDPLVLDLDGDGVELFSADEGYVLFDIDGNDGGYKERTGWVKADDGILVLDVNTNGQIDGITETISEKFNGGNYANAYAALVQYDANADGKISAADSIFSSLRVWQDTDSDGVTDAGELKTLASLNITQISLGSQTTQVGTGAATSYQLVAGNEVRATGTYTRSDNSTRTTASVNLVANAMGHSTSTTTPGTLMTSEAGTASFSTADTLGATINLATEQTITHAAGGGTVTTAISAAVKNAYGAQGNDVLIGDASANWLGGGLGSDTLQGGAGDDVLLIDAQDLQGNIDGGDGLDVAQVVGGAGVALNLAQAHVEVAIGGEGNDIFIGGGRSNVFVEGGAGDDLIIGGAADDALSGEDGDDLIDGGEGDDLIRGHRGRDAIYGGAGNDLLDGGLGDDVINAGAGNDIIQASAGDDTIDGGSEFDIVEFSGSYSQYRVTRTDQGIWVADTVAGRDGTDFLVGVEAMSFSDISRLRLNEGVIAPVADALTVTVNTASPSPITISAATLLANDVNIAGDPGTANSSTGSPLHILSVSDAVGGTVALNAGNVVFTPKAGYNGGYSFKYTVENQEGQYTAAVQQVGSTTQSAPMKGRVTLRTAEQPTDPLFGLQWYLNDANVVPVWKDYSGKGVRIGQFEPSNEFQTGKPVFDYRHPDLQQNVDAAWLASGTAATTFSNHATLVAGVMVAARNNEGGIGVAYDAKLSGVSVNLDDNASHAVDWSVLSQWKNYDVVNNSWGMTANFSADYLTDPEIAALQTSLQDAAIQGRNGLGTILVFGAGNGREFGQNANQMLSNSSFAIQVGAINTPADLGSLQNAQTPYSNPGASILVSAPGSNMSSTGIELTNAEGSTFYADAQTASGTSLATPLVSGVVALMLEANPKLGYRDVKEILALTARSVTVDPATPSDWTFNHATNWNGGGMHVSHDYGFGAVDAKAAVRLAETWQRTGTALNPNSGFDDNFISTSGEQIVNQAIPDGSGALTKTVTIQPGLLVEHAEVHLQLTHQRLGDLVVTLISPTGTQSVLVNRPGKAPGSGAGDLGDLSSGTLEYIFGSTHDLGELSAGTWTLKVEDKVTGSVGTLDAWELGLSGKDYHGEDNYVYTNEYASLAGGGRSVLSDAGGFDTLNAAAVDGNTVVNLQSGSATIAGAGLTIASGTTLEQVFTGDGNDTLTGDANRNRLSGGRGADIINGGAGQDIIGGDAGNDTLSGGADADLFVFKKDPNSTDTVTDFSVSAGERIALVGFGNLTFSGLTITQESANARVSLGSGQSVVLQNVTASSLTSEQFRFFDTFNFARVYIGTDAGEGANLDPAITLPALYFARGGDDQVVFASYGEDVIYGGSGNDVLAGDAVQDDPNGRPDAIYGEDGNDQIYGFSGDDILHGGAGDDYVQGDAGDDILFGDAGLDFIRGMDGNDSIYLEGDNYGPAGFTYVTGDGGSDRFIMTTANPTVAPGNYSNVIGEFDITDPNEKIDLTAFTNITSFGQLLMDAVDIDSDGTVSTRVRMGAGSTPSLVVYGVAPANLQVSRFIFYQPPAAAPGTSGNDAITGDGGGSVIDGGPGADVMTGRTGDDTYIVDNTGDVVNELPGGGVDTVKSSVSYALPAEVENLVLTGAGNTNGTGNALSNRITGNSGSNTLDGGASFDTLVGGAGDDTYIVDNGSDAVIELQNEGTDTVRSSASYTLSANVENLVLTGFDAVNATGNELNNSLLGNAQDNRIDGGAGVDTMTGGAGDDTYLVDNASDSVVENAGEGADTVYAGVTYTLAGNVENLILAGGASINATGNSLDNILIGNRGANVLTGGAGDDMLDGRTGVDNLVGGTGNDLYVVDNAGDGVSESANEGVDTVQSSISFSLASLPNVENVELTGTAAINATGNAAANRLTGNSAANVLDADGGDDVLDGGAGADTLIGGAGNDTYVVDNIADTVSEAAGGGTDTVVSYVSYSLASQPNLENVTLAGTGNTSGTGNAASNVLIGNAGNNALNGGGGNDTLDGWFGADALTGGAGDDTYLIDNTGDSVTESAGEGVDTVQATISYSLGSDVENLSLAGSGNINGTGNALNNVLTGNAGDNVLSADGGADTLSGGAGNDTLLGGTGNDLYTFDAGFGHDSITDNDAAGGNVDTIRFGAGIAPASVVASRSGQNLVLTLGANDVTVQSWYASAADKVERVEFAGGTVWDVNTLRTMTNAAPVLASALADQNATEDAAFTFTVPATTFSDADVSTIGDTLAYGATLSSGAALPSWLTFNAATRTFSGTPLNADVGNIDVRVTATDAVGASASDVFRITVANTNDAPTNLALSASTVAENAANAVVGNLSTTDVDAGDTFTYSIQPGGNGAQFVISGNQLKVGATGLDYEAGATRSVTVRTTDAAGAFFDKTLTVNVTNVNETPTDVALSANTVAENAANAVVGNLSTTDVDAGDTFTYSIQPGGNGAQFVISGNQLKVGATGLDYEAGATRSVTVRTTDAAGAFFDKTLTVNVTNVNETPTNIALSANTVAENAANAVVGNLSTTDVDAGDTFTYSIQPGGNGSQFVISGNQLKVGATGLDYEAGATRSVTVRTTDGAGAFFDKTLTVNVTNVNEAPTDVALSASTVAENAANVVVGNLSTTDQDAGETFTYSIQPGGNGSQFVISGNQLKVGASGLDYEAGATRSVTVRTTDAAGAFFDKTLTVNVTNVNEAPTDVALSANTVAENAANAVVGNLSTTDVDAGDTFTYSIQPGGNGSQFVISGNQLKVGTTSLDYEAGATRSVTVRSTDAAGAFFDKTFTVSVTNVNETPTVANTIADQNATENSAFSFAVPANTFADVDAGDTLTYSASRSDGSALPTWLAFNATTRTFSGTPLNGDIGTVSLKVTATDAGGLSGFDVFDVTVVNTNHAPTNLALSANTVAENAANAVVGNLSTTDVDAGDTFTYSIQPGGNGSQFVISGSQLKVGAGGLDYEAGATRSVTVRTTDAAGAFFDKTFTVNVTNANDTPTDVALSANTVAENAANAAVGTLSTTDPDAGDSFTYTIRPGGDGAQFVIVGNELRVGTSGLDYEAGATRNVTVRTTDAAGAFFDKVVTVNVTNVNEAPTNIGLSPSTIAENAPNATVGTLSTTDVDAGDAFTYSIQPVGDGAQFVISGSQLKVGTVGLDYEAGATRSVTVRTTDAAGAFFDKTFTVNVSNVNETPANIALSANTVAENAANAVVGNLSTTDVDAGDSFTYSIQPGGNGAQFVISGNQLKVGGTGLDYEAGASRSVTVRTTDAAGAFFDKTFTVNVTNVNETPTNIALSANTVAENAANATVGTLSTTDPDAGDTFTYSIQPVGDGAQFTISGNQLKVGASGLDFEAGATRSVTVRTTDAAGAFFDKVLTVNVTNVNEAPTNIALSPSTIAENTANATVGTLSTSDVDAGDTFTYSIQPGGDGAQFTISANQLKVGASGLDFEAGATRSVTVRATDAAGAFFDKAFTVNVSNVNETPTNIALSANTVAENAANATVGTLSTTDPDAGDTFTYSIQPGGNGSQFAISGNQLKVGATGLDYEAGVTRSVTVRTTDAAGAFFDKTLTVNVTNANETPTNIALSANTVAENAANATVGTLLSTDPDSGDTFTYSIQPGGDGAQFTISGNQLKVGASGLDFEAGATRSVTVRTTDAAGAFFDKVLAVNVTNVNEAPTNIALSPSTIAENTPNATVGTLSTTDVDAGDTFAYSIQPGGDGSQFVISGSQLKVGASGLDFEAGATRSVTVRTTDAAGAFFDKTFTVNVSNVNETPTNIALSANTVAENAANVVVGNLSTTDVDAGDTFSYSIQPGGNGAQFVISGNQLKVGATGLDYEAGATRSVTVRTTDTAGAFFDKTLTVNVTNVNEAPTDVALSASTVAENAANVVVGNLSTTDVDAGDTFTYSIQPGGAGSQFVISGNQLKVGATGLDYEAGATRSVTVRTTDAAGAFFDKVLTVNVTNVNEAPTNIALSPNTIVENTANATVGTLSTSDVDAGDTFTYSIQPGGDGAQFTISGNQLKVGATGLDYEAGATRSVTVRTTDAAGAFFDKTFTVNVSNVNETPTNIALSANTVAENAANAIVGTLSTTDQDAGDTFTYSIQPGGNGSQFAISGSQLKVGATGLDYEAGATRSVTVRTTDASGAFFDKTFTVNVTNVNETPTVANAISDQNAFENQAFSFTFAANAFADPDAGDTLAYTATLVDGSVLPAWLSFNASTRTFSGTPSAANNGTIAVKVSAADGSGLSTFDVFDLAVTPSVINGTAGNDNLVGSAFNDTINGLGGNDTLSGLAGADLLDGGTGVDAMSGGAGNDTYVVDNTADTVTENANEGTDLVQSSASFTLGANVENLTLTGGAAINGTGNASDNVLTGNAGNNMLSGAAGTDALDGGAGTDWLWGGSGNDSYVVDNAGDVVTEALTTTTTYQWQNQYYWNGSQHVSNWVQVATGTSTLAPAAGVAPVYSGSTTSSYQTQDHGNWYLQWEDHGHYEYDGEGGSYWVSNWVQVEYWATSNVQSEVSRTIVTAGDGVDAVSSSVSHTLTYGVENLTLTGTGDINGTGNAANNVLTGNAGNNVLDGGAGADAMSGGAGNDTYIVDNAGDVVTESAGEGLDTVQASVSHTLSANVENLQLIGGALNINGTGNALDNVLLGNPGANVLAGGAGNDTYYVGAGDTVVENANEGADNVYSDASFTIGANVENLTLTGSGNLNGTGNAANNVITGNAGNNVLDGAAGADQMAGGAGNDTYVVDNAADTVTENANEGTDLVQSSVTYTLSANVENLTLTGSAAINGMGNAANNMVVGNTGSNGLDGGAGTDWLWGGAGNDSYGVDNAGDVVTEALTTTTTYQWQNQYYWNGAQHVSNWVQVATGTSTLQPAAGVAPVYSGSTTSGYATEDHGNWYLQWEDHGYYAWDGESGYYWVSNWVQVEYWGSSYVSAEVSRTIVTAGDGVDSVSSSVSHTLTYGVENLTLTGAGDINGTGNASNNVITGNSGNNVLDGGAGADTLIGGAGNDTYIVDNAGDTVTENAAEGTELVQSSVSFTLGANLENLTLTGSGNVNGTGNAANNVINGNSGNNVLDGGAGADTLAGGAGNDTYVLDPTDTVVENAGEGVDTIQIGISYTLGATLENLTLTGSADLNGTGNAANNVIIGNAGNNVLDGGTGADTMSGGAGNDTFVVDNAADTVSENANEGTDLVQSSATFTLGANVENLTLTGSGNINGTGNASDNALTGNAGNNMLSGAAGADVLDGGAGTDWLWGGAGNDSYGVDNAGDVVTEALTTTTTYQWQNQYYWNGAQHVSNWVQVATGTSTLQPAAGVAPVYSGSTTSGYATEDHGNWYLQWEDHGYYAWDGESGYYWVSNWVQVEYWGSSYVSAEVSRTIVTAGDGVDSVSSSVSHTLTYGVENLTLTGAGDVNGTGNAASNYIRGNSGNNVLSGGAGIDVMEGGGGNDTLSDTGTSEVAFLAGGSGSDTLSGGNGREFLAGGTGNDIIHTADGSDIVAFNLGDGQDSVDSTGTAQDNVLALGGGITYASLKLSKSGNDLVLASSANDSVTLKNWYAGSKSFGTLQVVIEASSDYNAGSGDATLNKKVERFDLTGLANRFDQERAANPSLTEWALSNALTQFHLGGSDTAALGGDLAYYLGKNGTLANMGVDKAVEVLNASAFGQQTQTIRDWATLQTGVARLSQ